jgi:hypothetical protein
LVEYVIVASAVLTSAPWVLVRTETLKAEPTPKVPEDGLKKSVAAKTAFGKKANAKTAPNITRNFFMAV